MAIHPQLRPGIHVASSLTPGYGDLLALVESGQARFVGEHIDPRGVKAVAVEVGPASNPTIGISQAFFTTVLRDYDDWKVKWWREAIQNAVDAGATKIRCEVVQREDGTFAVAIDDNGSGMSESVLVDKFLMLGATTKPAQAGAAGGFGKAKELLILPWLGWEVHTGDRVAQGEGLTYSVGPAERRKGTRLEVVMAADQHTDTAAALEFIGRSNLPGVSFVLHRTAKDGTKGSWRPKANLAGTSLVDSVPEKADIFTAKASGDRSFMYVRVKGLYMFDIYVGEIKGKQLLCEITAPSVEVLTANRDGFRDRQVRRAVSELGERLAKDVLSALRAKKGLLREKFAGVGRFKAEQREADALSAIGPVPESAQGVVNLSKEQLAALQQFAAMMSSESAGDEGVASVLPDARLAGEMLNTVTFTGAHHVQSAMRQLVWQPDFYLINEVEGYKVPKRFRPETMTKTVLRLVRTWTELCRFVLMQLGEFRPFGVGLIFTEDARAAYQPDGDEHWLLLNPFADVKERGRVLSPTKLDDLKWLYAAAVHECTHLSDGISYHDEAFAAALTQNMATTADGFKKVRGIARALASAAEVTVDVPVYPSAPSPPALARSGYPTTADLEARERALRVRSADQFPENLLPAVLDILPSYMRDRVPVTAHTEMVQIFRSVPPEVEEIRPGDWVALRPKYAELHGRGRLLSEWVPVGHVMWAGTDENEWFYVPRARPINPFDELMRWA